MFSIDLTSGNLLLLLSVLVFIAVLSNKIGTKFGVPSMLVFLLIGMLAGQDGLGLKFANLHLAEFVCHLGMTFILLQGGLETEMHETKPVLRQGVLLSTVGVLLTILITGGFIYLVAAKAISGVATITGCMLVAAVLSSTDSTAVFSILRSKRLQLREHLGPMLELESGSNDPMAYASTIILVKLINGVDLTFFHLPEWATGLAVVLILAYQLAVGFLVGFLVGRFAKWILPKLNLSSSPLISILVLSLAFFANGFGSLIGGNGLLALYVAAIIIGNSPTLPQKREVLKFFDGMSWLSQLLMVLLLGVLARPSHMAPVLVPALLIGLFLIFVARPAAVFLTLLPYRKLPARAKLFVSWVGIKGAGPILFALYAVVHEVGGSVEIFNIVLVITLLSLLFQGMTLPIVAKWLNLSIDEDPEVETFGLDLPEEMGMMRDHIVGEEELTAGQTLRDLHLPHGIRVIMVKRGERFLVPHGSMKLEVKDHLLIMMGETDD
ncbi:MAG: potassium/proton antiporter [Bacteroidales bacterium]|nr:potassium/proton antiporter [Bacteroidales bacterium]